MIFETCAAISTPIGFGGIAIVRMSGDKAIYIADEIFEGKTKASKSESHKVLYGKIYDDDILIDEVLLLVMKEGRTYTKEDLIEIQCHGGLIASKKILELCLKKGARLAEAGEFTKRAFLNGRIDLNQSEGIIDMINSLTDLSYQNSLAQMQGALSIKLSPIMQEILDMTAFIEATIDYPEYEYDEEENVKDKCEKIIFKIDELLKTFDRGKIIRDGLDCVILGKPNVGKSSLLNLLLDEERAIVSDIAGTTRDSLSEHFNLDGILINLIDTAGIRATDDKIEKLGVKRSKDLAKKADLILLVLDSSNDLDDEDLEILKLTQDMKTIIILNKKDLAQNLNVDKLSKFVDKKNIIEISSLNNKDLNKLFEKIKELFYLGISHESQDYYLSNTRHKDILLKAKLVFDNIIENIDMIEIDFISIDLQEAYTLLSEITGDSIKDDLIDRIFDKFCLGK